MLGLWGVAWKILQIPIALFQALWRVSFPGMSRLVADDEDLGPTIERVIGLVAIGTGVILAPLAASAAAWIHLLLGARWAGAAPAIPPACFAMMFSVPISVALAGYLWAIGLASVPLRTALLGIPALAVIMLPLLPVLGIVAAGLGYIGSAAVESVMFVRAARQTTSFTVGARVGVPVVGRSRLRSPAGGWSHVGSDQISPARWRARQLPSECSWGCWGWPTAPRWPKPGGCSGEGCVGRWPLDIGRSDPTGAQGGRRMRPSHLNWSVD